MDSASMEAKTTPSLKPYYEHGGVVIYHGDCRDILARLEPASVQCCVTSPPYWGLRDYGIPPSIWGGDKECDHEWADASWRPARWGGSDDDNPGDKQRTNGGSLGHRGSIKQQATCARCGAWLGNLGLEPTPDLFFEHIVEVFAAVWRVLKSDGTLWLNLGDSYCATDKWGGGGNVGKNTVAEDGSIPSWTATRARKPHVEGIKPKDLVGIPWACAFALRSAGWYLRSDIIWHKPNPMPESVTDRPTKSHEYIFLLSKNAKYYYDFEAAKEVSKGHGSGNKAKRWGTNHTTERANGHGTVERQSSIPWEPGQKRRNRRSVWSVTTKPTPEAHFATFPPKLIEPCILAGCPEGGVVLDPFSGSGTTAMVCKDLGRRFVGAELNPEYIAIAERRIGRQEVLF